MLSDHCKSLSMAWLNSLSIRDKKAEFVNCIDLDEVAHSELILSHLI